MFGRQMLWNLFVIEREKLKSARQSKSYVKVPPPPFPEETSPKG